MKELMKFTLLTRGQAGYLTDRYRERKKRATKKAQADQAVLSGAAG